MTWEWSHAPEAYADAEQNLRNLPIDELRIIWAEWCAASRDEWGNWDCNEFDSDAFHKYLNHAESLPAEALAADIWDRASELRSCTNGGHFAYMCPYGCDPHQVSFDSVHEHGNDYC